MKILFDPNPSDGGLDPNDGGTPFKGMEDLVPIEIKTSQPEEHKEEKVVPIEEVVSSKEEIVKEVSKLSMGDFDEIVKAPIVKQKDEVKQKDDKRDYSMFRAEDLEFVKKSNNEAYDFLKVTLPKYYEAEKKAKTLESKAPPESWYQHKEAYVLSEDYQEAQNDYRYAAFEEGHWKKQLEAIKNGATEYSHLEGYYKNGNPILKNIPVSSDRLASVEIGLAQNITESAQARIASQKQAIQIQTSWNNDVTRVVDELKQAESKYYPFYDKPNENQQNIMKEISGMIPKIFQNNPLTSYVVKAGTLNVELVSLVKSLKSEIAKLKTGKADISKIGPNGSEVTPAGSSTGNVLSMKDFKD